MYDYSSGTWKQYSDAGGGNYYLFGYINGDDYACEADASNMGEYRFVDGKLEARFTMDSYVAVKRENNAQWFMTNGWLGTDVTSATLYDTSITGSNSDKLYVPGEVDLVFMLKENSDGTLSLSYTKKNITYSVQGTLTGTLGNTELVLCDRASSKVMIKKTVSNNQFELPDVQPGSYLLTVSNPGRPSRSYPVAISSQSVKLAVSLWQFGDLNGDGKINLGDTARIYSHIRGTGLIADEYARQCADLDQNDKLNLGDVARCYALIRGN